jgi:hypothetical protein
MSPRLNKAFNLLVAVPLLAVCFFVTAAFLQGNTGFRVDKTQQGLLVSHISLQLNPVIPGDLIVAIEGLDYNSVLGFLLFPAEKPDPHTLTVLRDGEQFTFTVKTIP